MLHDIYTEEYQIGKLSVSIISFTRTVVLKSRLSSFDLGVRNEKVALPVFGY